MYFFSVIGEIQVEEENDLHLIKIILDAVITAMEAVEAGRRHRSDAMVILCANTGLDERSGIGGSGHI